ncbi:hypothetical protein JKF63_00073 [Porcisia hertigi]|uniref:Uncharacterized protein n=1 Tax=Porcisia hertigi TaxID=2761500 RepID=A0A836I7L3_9TRYP|nr:hypothetical protein JKF63_00073 [Porcisia hertigi]
MGRDKPPPALRFARQWTLPSSAAGDAGFILEYPPRHTESISPLRDCRASLTPSPSRSSRRYPLEGSLVFGSPSPLPPTAVSACASQGATAHGDASLQLSLCPAPAGELGKGSAANSAQPAGSANDREGMLFWRRQAQRLKESCIVLEDELNTVYRSLAQGSAGGSLALAVGSQVSSVAVGGASLSYEAVLQERNVARLELAREKEKNFLLRHRLRETEAELDQLHPAHARGAEKHRIGNESLRVRSSSNPAWRVRRGPSQQRCFCGRSSSNFRSSTQSAPHARSSATSPLSPSSTRLHISSSVRQEQPTRPAPKPLSVSSTRCSEDNRASRSSTASVSSSVRQEVDHRALTASAEAPAPFTRFHGHGMHSPSKPTPQSSQDHQGEARKLLTSLLSARSPPQNNGHPAVWRKSSAGSHDTGLGCYPTLIGFPRHVFRSGLFSPAVPPQGRRTGESEYVSIPPWDAVGDARAMQPRGTCSRCTVTEGGECLGEDTQSGEWPLWQPHGTHTHTLAGWVRVERDGVTRFTRVAFKVYFCFLVIREGSLRWLSTGRDEVTPFPCVQVAPVLVCVCGGGGGGGGVTITTDSEGNHAVASVEVVGGASARRYCSTMIRASDIVKKQEHAPVR